MGWGRGRYLFGGCEFGHFDQVTFLILGVHLLLLAKYLELLRSGGVRGAQRQAVEVSVKRPDAGAERVGSRKRRFRLSLSISYEGLTLSARLIRLSASNCAFDGNSAAGRHRFEIISPRGPTQADPRAGHMGFRLDGVGIARMAFG
jgi:hypothetical protein